MKISAIVAQAENRVIGRGNALPWHLPADLKYFKKITVPHHVIMGRKVFFSIPEKYRPLKDRVNLILSRNRELAISGTRVFHNIADALGYAQDEGEEEVMVIGGEEIYRQFLPLLDRIYLTQIHAQIQGDKFFPVLNREKWHCSSRESHKKDSQNPYDYSFLIYERK